jgi:hypothetical protein
MLPDHSTCGQEDGQWGGCVVLDLRSTGGRLQNTLTISEDVLALPADVRPGFIAKGRLEGHGGQKSTTSYQSYLWDARVSWLVVQHYYNVELAVESDFMIGGQYVRLDRVKVWTPEEYAEVEAKFPGSKPSNT